MGYVMHLRLYNLAVFWALDVILTYVAPFPVWENTSNFKRALSTDLPKPYQDRKPHICIIHSLSVRRFTEKFRKKTRENLFLTLILKRGTLTP